MNRSLIVQISILGMILVISYFAFTYINKNSNDDLIENSIQKKENQIISKVKVDNDDTETNKIIDLSYKSNDEKGNIYQINSTSGSISGADENILILENVNAEISIFNYGIFFIKSDKAKYNRLTLDTHFFNNVNLNYLNHIVESEDLFLKYMDKEIKILNSVKYKNNENLLEADKVDLDLASKTSKIYMKDKNKKVKAVIKN
tara:strand:- start:2710 stop:3318 length:609 start_codon:yes stop_codon:yes gene_type:complete